MKAVITGGSGFLGTNLTLWLQEHEPLTEIVIFDTVPPLAPLNDKTHYVYGDVRDLKTLVAAFAGADEVYHLAGLLGTSELVDMTALACDVNIRGTANVLDACQAQRVPRLYNVAKPHFESLSENAYTLTKLGGELLGLMYRQIFGLSVATVRWTNAVGPYQHLYPVRKFVPLMVLLALHDLPLEIYGSGRQTIDPLDVRDLAKMTVYACRNLGQHPDVLDLGSGIGITCNDAAETILTVVRDYYPTTSEIAHIPMRVGEADNMVFQADMRYWENIDMLPEFSFRESVRTCVEYIRTLPEWQKQNALRFYGK